MSSPPIIAVSYDIDVRPLLSSHDLARVQKEEGLDLSDFQAVLHAAPSQLERIARMPSWSTEQRDRFQAWLVDGKQP